MPGAEDAVRFVCFAAQQIRDGQVCFVGIGVPSLATMTARRVHAPNAVLIYESGAIDANPPVPPLSTGSPSVVADTTLVTSCLGVFAMLQRGCMDVGILSAAQVDRFGNLNSSRLQRPGRAPLQLVGSGGACDIALLASQVLIMMPHDPRRFVERVDFVTSPGSRSQRELFLSDAARGGGPTALITPRARFSFEAGELTLDALAPGVEADEALEGIPWQVPRAATVRRTAPFDDVLWETAAELLADSPQDVG